MHPCFVQAAALALERGWSINIGGGMHHAHSGGGAGWCMFSDLILALRKLRKETQGMINKVMIIDTDVHQVWHQVLIHTPECIASIDEAAFACISCDVLQMTVSIMYYKTLRPCIYTASAPHLSRTVIVGQWTREGQAEVWRQQPVHP